MPPPVVKRIKLSLTGNNRYAMKKKNLLLTAILLVVAAAALLALAACDDLSGLILPQNNRDVAEQVVRIHIRANSNGSGDQSVKLKVRDAVTDYLTDALKDCRSKTDALAALNAESDALQNIAQNTLEENGYEYGARVLIGREHFPEREYDGYVFPEGDYDAIVILLGEGAGDNWWCVAFPPLCFVPDGGGEGIIYKSWVKELLDGIFG